jgi:alpha-N-acetylglucosaminidase
MRWIKLLLWFCLASAAAQSTEGLYSLVKRLLPNHVDHFRFTLDADFGDSDGYDQFLVQSAHNGTILVHGNSLSALSSGYAQEEIHL